VIVAPPSDAGVDHDTVARASPATAVTASGALGVVIGITDDEGVDAVPAPTALDATTTKV
jgi:hypothetical protein